tara:strand:+ start:488 stop:754 length:267 start_codon:yes stop_codon:yes gene_type:complete
MAFKMKYKNLQEVVDQLKGAVKAHGKQAKVVEEHIKDMESPAKMKSPLKGKISASCKAQAKKKFKVWPSAYASGWGVRCTRGDFKKKK